MLYHTAPKDLKILNYTKYQVRLAVEALCFFFFFFLNAFSYMLKANFFFFLKSLTGFNKFWGSHYNLFGQRDKVNLFVCPRYSFCSNVRVWIIVALTLSTFRFFCLIQIWYDTHIFTLPPVMRDYVTLDTHFSWSQSPLYINQLSPDTV